MVTKNPAAVALGRLGGLATSPRKTKAARLNAKKGGRPKKRKGLTALLLLLSLLAGSTVHAQSLKMPAIVLGAAGAADIGTTLWLGHRSELTEVNPLINWIKDPIPMVMFGAAVETVAVTLIARKLSKTHPKWAAAGLYIAAGIHAGFAIRNAHHMALVMKGTQLNNSPVMQPAYPH